MTGTDSVTENVKPVKVKVQKRTPTERQLEALDKARKEKLKKKIISDATPLIKKDFLFPSPYLVGTILAGSAVLAGYYYMKPVESSGSTQASYKPNYIPVQVQQTYQKAQEQTKEVIAKVEPLVQQTNQRLTEFLTNSINI